MLSSLYLGRLTKTSDFKLEHMNKRLFVAGLPFSTTEDELKDLFSAAGNVTSATIINDRETCRPKGFGFVEMETTEEAEAAIKKISNTDFDGRKLIVAEAKPMEDRRGGSQRGGGFGKRRGFGRREGGRGNYGRDGRGSHRLEKGRFSR